MEVSDQHHASASSLPKKEPPAPISWVQSPVLSLSNSCILGTNPCWGAAVHHQNSVLSCDGLSPQPTSPTACLNTDL